MRIKLLKYKNGQLSVKVQVTACTYIHIYIYNNVKDTNIITIINWFSYKKNSTIYKYIYVHINIL